MLRLGLNIAGANLSIFDDVEDQEKGLDIDFVIEKSIGSEPNKSAITLWNISSNTYQALEKATAVELYSAFDKDDYSLMFTGNVEMASQQKSEIVATSNAGFLKQDDDNRQVDVPTTITLYDAGFTYKNAVISKSYKGVVSTQTIINDCLEKMGIPKGKVITEYPSITNYVARGKCISVLNYITERMGCYYNITNGFFNLSKTDNIEETQGIYLTSDNSNRPERVTVDKELGWRIETGLLPYLLPDTYCQLQFENVSGIFRIKNIKHKGNNYGTEGITEVFVV